MPLYINFSTTEYIKYHSFAIWCRTFLYMWRKICQNLHTQAKQRSYFLLSSNDCCSRWLQVWGSWLLVNLGLNCCEVPGKLSKMTFTHIKGSEDDKNLTGVWYRLRPRGFSLSFSRSSSCPPSRSRADVWTSTNLNGSVTIIRENLKQELHQCLTHIKRSRMTSVAPD